MKMRIGCILLVLFAWTFSAFVRLHGGFFLITTDSMKPTFQAGDIVLAWGKKSYVKGDIIVFKNLKGKVTTHRIQKGKPGCFTTKGDRNIDVDAYKPCISRVIGKVIAIIPFSILFPSKPFSLRTI